MEEHLRSLADSLGECSRLVSQVLAGTSSSSNTKVPDSVTQVVSENNLSSRSNVSSAVERAQSMLERRRSTGLCSRLSQRERLRSASPSVPSSNRGKKQKTTPEQSKPFEFALMYVGDADDDDEENLSINHDNILLRGFVNLVNTDGEADIRSKIGDAIKLKYSLVGNRDFVFLRANRRKLSTPVSCEEYTYKQVKLLCGQGAIYIKMKSGLNCLTCDDDGTSLIEDDDLPGKFCCVFSFHSQKLLVGSIYRPPDYANFFIEFPVLMEGIWRRRTNIVLLGDFNVNLLPSATNSGDFTLKRKFLHQLSKFNLKNVINVPTRITGNSSTLIDLIITSVSHKLSHHGACNLGISDHHLIYAAINLRRPRHNSVFRFIRDLKNVNITALQHEFATAPWNICDIFDDIDDSVWAWETLYNYIIDHHIPIRKVKIRSNSLPWMSSSLRKEMNKRYKLLTLAQNTPKGSNEWSTYKKQRNLCTKLLRTAELTYWKDKFSDAKSSKEFWKTVKLFQGTNKSSSIGPIKDSQGILLTDDTLKANAFNSYFTNICSTLNITAVPHPPLPTNYNSNYRSTPTLPSLNVNQELLSFCVKHHIKANKASGPDNIDGKVLRLLGDAFTGSFSVIARKSFADCKFPQQWKTAKVRCIHKKGSQLDCGNYRPISLLSQPSKLLESLVCKQLDAFLEQHSLINSAQWGFRKGRSTELLLLHMTERWRHALNQGQSIGVIFLDFQKAFDCVSHQLLPSKLQASGICHNALDWILDYLCNRNQYVSINGFNSTTMAIPSGVPQGSLLGPRLFTIFTNDLPSCLESCNSSNMEMFADDSTAFVIGDCVDSIVVHINKALQLLHDWAQLNCMSIHPTKTEIMFISKSPFIGPIPPITLDNHLINCTSQSTILGVALDNKLCWKPHIKQISANFNAKINKLKQIKSFDLPTLETIYFKGILPSTTYCISLWGSSSSLQALEESHIRAARLIHNLSPSLPKHEILSKVKWHSLSYFYKKRLACIAYQAYFNLAPSNLTELFTKHATKYNLRDNLKFDLTHKFWKGQNDSFIHRASIIWNSLPTKIKTAPSLAAFKASLVKNSKCIDSISFGCSATGTFKNSEDFIYF